MSSTRVMWWGLSALTAVGLLVITASPASAQDDGPTVAVTGGLDFTNQYNFRGIRQNSEGVSIWPYVDLGIGAYTGEGGLKSVTLNFGTWNALHSQINEDDFGTGNKWYESDLYATVGFGFGATSLGVTYTSYTSPADLFAHVKELSLKVAVDDSGALGAAALKPYVLVAFELDDNGADGIGSQGTYVELGVAPGVAGERASVAFPVKLGFSASDYYEFGTGDDAKFGYFSVAGIVTVPLNANWNLHGGGELQVFGDRLRAVNGFGADDPGDEPGRATGIASIGIGFSF